MGLTIAVPVYNEEALIEANTRRLVQFLGPLDTAFEILLCSNGSTDATIELGRRLGADIPEVRFFELPERAVGRAFKLFAREARHDSLISVDMDLSIDLQFIPRAARLLEEFDVVVGSKWTGTQKRSLFRRAGSGLFVHVASALLGLDFVDYSIGAKAYRLAAVRDYAEVLSDGSAYVLDLVYYVHRDGGRVTQIPVACEDYRKSRFNLAHEAVHKFYRLGRLWRYRDLEVPRQTTAEDEPGAGRTTRRERR